MNARSPLYDNGLLRFKGEYLDGEMHGYWEFYRKDGSMMRSGTFERGIQVDVWKTFDREGNLVKETKFRSA
jgi:antitoxin component YwqK of YwqJK toxin-antitoxin module